MAECEVCGEDGAELIALIEGAKLRVCYDCSKRGKVLSRVAPPPASVKKMGARPAGPSAEIEFVSDYADRIRAAREKMRIGVDVVAELVMEKESYLRRVEAGKALPSEELARKLEKQLGIRLFETVSYGGVVPPAKGPAGGLTLGDMIIVKKKTQGQRKR